MNKKIVLQIFVSFLLLCSCSNSNDEPNIKLQNKLFGNWYSVERTSTGSIFGKGNTYKLSLSPDGLFQETTIWYKQIFFYDGTYYIKDDSTLIMECSSDYRGYDNEEYVRFYFKKDTLMLDVCGFCPFIKRRYE